jgi:hypothetical protein
MNRIIGVYCEECGEQDLDTWDLIYLPEISKRVCRVCYNALSEPEPEPEISRAIIRDIDRSGSSFPLSAEGIQIALPFPNNRELSAV